MSNMQPGREEVVVSGMAGKFPGSSSVAEFREKLFSKANLLQPDLSRWNPAKDQRPYVTGKMPDWDRFDRSFFGIPSKLAKNCDPMLGHILEKSFEAMIDAGVNPFSTKGMNVAVTTGTSLSEAEILRTTGAVFIDGFGMVGHSRTMMANRVSYVFNFTGPSYNCDSSWTSATEALAQAAALVGDGHADAALVVAVNMVFCCSSELEYDAMHILSPDRTCSPFDAEAGGMARGEGVVALFLQRARDARRNYCSVLGVGRAALGHRSGSFLQLSPTIRDFLSDFYSQCGVSPAHVSYVEAGGYCDKESDSVELNALAEVFCQDERQGPLLVGSLVGSTGHPEAASGLLSMVKVIIALESGLIPPTLNHRRPNPAVPALLDGRIQVVTETQALVGDCVGFNCMNFAGAVSHVLLKRGTQAQARGRGASDDLPRLVTLQARHEAGARAVTDKIYTMGLNKEFVSLVNDTFKTPIPAYLWRGYAILSSDGGNAEHNVQVFDPSRRPLWFVFSGMGSQWPGMGRELMAFPVFAAAMDRCDRVLRPRGLDIRHIITTQDTSIFDNILHAFVGIAAIQVGLTDLLTSLGVRPDGLVGHSVGEIACSYADGCFDTEQVILCSYYRGLASVEATLVPGMMAAVGLGYQDIKDRVPPAIDVACHNSRSSCTLSGPTEDVLRYVAELQKDGIFAKAVSAGGIAYHSRYIQEIGPNLLKYLKEVVKTPRARSSRWVSSSVPQDQWTTQEARLCSAEYHVNNLLRPVIFEEACTHLPKNAILLEIAPHGLMQAILKRSVDQQTTTIALTSRQAESPAHHLLHALGKLYLHNVCLDVNALYPPVLYPVPRDTPGLAELVTWDHEETCYLEFSNVVEQMLSKNLSEKDIEVNVKSTDYQLWQDHRVQGQVVLPLAQLLMYPWKMISDYKRQQLGVSGVVMDDVTVGDYVTVTVASVDLQASFTPSTFKFELTRQFDDNNNSVVQPVITGTMKQSEMSSFIHSEEEEEAEVGGRAEEPDVEEVDSEGVYYLLAQTGCQLGPQFQLIEKILIGQTESVAKIRWSGNLVPFLEAVFNFIVFLKTDEHQDLFKVAHFNKLSVNTPLLTSLPTDSMVEVRYNRRCNSVVSEAVELLGVTLSHASPSKPDSLAWSELRLQPYFDTTLSLEDFLSVSVQLVSEAALGTWGNTEVQVKILEVKNDNGKPSVLSQLVKESVKGQPFLPSAVMEVDVRQAKELVGLPGRHSVLLAGEHHVLASVVEAASCDSVFCLTTLSSNGASGHGHGLRPVLGYQSQAGRLVLLKKASGRRRAMVFEMKGLGWLGELRRLMEQDSSDCPVVVISHAQAPREVLPLLAKEPYAHRLRTVFILDRNAPRFSASNPLYTAQLSLDLPVNILRGGLWSSLRTTGLAVPSSRLSLAGLLTCAQDDVQLMFAGLNTTTFSLEQELRLDVNELRFVDYSGHLGSERVMGMAEVSADVNNVSVDPLLQWPVPASWALDDAATVPVLYTLAYYCVHLKARLEAGERVLVHDGLSPLGQAVIAVALAAGATVFASVTREEDVVTLEKMCPALKPGHVVSLGGQGFWVGVQQQTAGRGVQVIISCLRGPGMQSTLRVMGVDCRFLHLGHISLEDRESIGMLVFLKRTSFCGVTLENVAHCTEECKAQLKDYVQKGIQDGVVKPLKKSCFPLNQQQDALFHMRTQNSKKKTILMTKQEDKTPNTSRHYHCNPNHLILIAGRKNELWLDVAEWLVRRGARRLVVLSEQDQLVNSHVRRINKLVTRYRATIVISSLSRVDSHKGAVDFFKEVLRIGNVSSIFCVCVDDNSILLRNLDSASRQMVPQLEQFVCLLGEGVAVCESRALGGLPTCCVQSDAPLQTPSQVLPYLDAILSGADKSKFYMVKDQIRTTGQTAGWEAQTFLPSTVEELHALGVRCSAGVDFTEVVTRSPGHAHTRYCLLPVFVVPCLSHAHLQPLLRQLIHPAFCCFPLAAPDSLSPQQLVESLLQDVLKVQSHGPYNVVGEGWNGAFALMLGSLLEAQGHHVRLFLLDGAWTTARNSGRALCDRYSSDLSCGVLAASLGLPPQAVAQVSAQDSWQERLRVGLRRVPEGQWGAVATALSSLSHQLTQLSLLQAPLLFKGKVTLISCHECPADLADLSQVCLQTPEVVVTGDADHDQLIASAATATLINQDMAYSWRP